MSSFEAMVDKFVLDNLNLFSTTALKVREQLQKFAADLVKQTEDACKPKLTGTAGQVLRNSGPEVTWIANDSNPGGYISGSGSITGNVITTNPSKYDSSRAKDLSGLHYKDIDPR